MKLRDFLKTITIGTIAAPVVKALPKPVQEVSVSKNFPDIKITGVSLPSSGILYNRSRYEDRCFTGICCSG